MDPHEENNNEPENNNNNNNNEPKKEEKKPEASKKAPEHKVKKVSNDVTLGDNKIPTITPHLRCKLRLLRLERVNDYLTLERDFLTSVTRISNAPAVGGSGDHVADTIIQAAAAKEKADEASGSGAGDKEEGAAASSAGPRETHKMKEMINRLRGTPLEVGEFEEFVDDNHAIVNAGAASFYVPVLSIVDRRELGVGSTVLLHEKTNAVVGLLPSNSGSAANALKVETAPVESYSDIGGLEEQIMEMRETVEFPLTHPELYDEIGIQPPKGVVLYGPPGTGKTLLAKAVAHETSATFLRVTGSELVKMYLGEGPKMVRDLFKAAAENTPAIVFIDEIDAVGTKRRETRSSGEREVQRTMLELLNQLDGFDSRGDIKVIIATNRIETLDPALIRPGRIDRKIEFKMPDTANKRKIFEIHTQKMTLHTDVDLEEFVMSKEELSGADIKAICTEAGLLALRERRMKVTQMDFKKAKDKVLYRKAGGAPDGLYV